MFRLGVPTVLEITLRNMIPFQRVEDALGVYTGNSYYTLVVKEKKIDSHNKARTHGIK